MAYQFADGFDSYGNSTSLTAGYPYDTVFGSAITSTADQRFAAPSPTPGGCLTLGQNNWVIKNLSSNQATLIIGFGWKTPVLPTTGNAPICYINDGGTTQCSLCFNSIGQLVVLRGQNAGTQLGTSSNSLIIPNAWYGFQFQVTINGSTGAFQVFVNGAAVAAINLSNVNTQSTANAFAGQVQLISPNVAGTWKFDDFFCFDGSGGALNALPGGDVRIITKMPSGVGNYTNWTPTGLANNWQNAAPTPPNTSDFNANNVATTKDSYAMQAPGLTSAPVFVLARASMTRDDAGPHTPSIFVRSGATDSSGVVTPALTASYLYYDAVFANDPNTSAPWTGAGADAAQVGVIEG